MIRTVLKKIFPRAFLKRCFLVYNKTKIRTIDKIVYREYYPAQEELFLYNTYLPFRDYRQSIEQTSGTQAYKYFTKWLDWEQEEHLVRIDHPVTIEPEYGWGLIKPNVIIYQSLAFSRTDHQKKPDLVKFLSARKVIKVDKAFSLRDTGEENYFHFYNDVIAKIYYAIQHGINLEEYAVIVAGRLAAKEYFAIYVSNNPFLSSLNWVIQNDEYVRCNTVVFCKPPTHKLQLWNNFIFNIPFSGEGIRIFLNRGRLRLRFIENVQEIEAVCLAKNFLIIDSDQLTFEQQVEIFSKADVIAGIHGAGMTNMVYSSHQCRILEIFPPPEGGYLPYHYLLLSAHKNFAYQAIIGEPGKEKFSGGFYLHPRKFKEQLDQFLAE